MNDDDEDEPNQWSVAAKAALEIAARDFRAALDHYNQSLLDATTALQVPELLSLQNRLGEATRAYVDAHFDHTGMVPPLLPTERFQIDDSYAEDEEPVERQDGLVVVWRADFVVEDAQEIMDQGRRVCSLMQPEMTAQEVANDVTSLGRALYWIDHSRESALYEIEGLAPVAAVKMMFSTESPQMTPECLEDEDFKPFALPDDYDSRLIYKIEDV